MSDEGQSQASASHASAAAPEPTWQPIPSRQRRVLGVLMEKAKTTPDAYPMSLAALVAGANQKSNRAPLMNMTPEQVEDELAVLRRIGAAAEVQGSGRVPRYRHYGHNWLGVKGAEAAVLIELLLRGHQTAGDLRVRASRFEPIPDLNALHAILDTLMARKLVIALTPPGRGQLFSHNLYTPDELHGLKSKIARGGDSIEAAGDDETSDESDPISAASERTQAPATRTAASSSTAAASMSTGLSEEVADLRTQVADLRNEVDQLKALVSELQGELQAVRSLVDG